MTTTPDPIEPAVPTVHELDDIPVPDVEVHLEARVGSQVVGIHLADDAAPELRAIVASSLARDAARLVELHVSGAAYRV